MAQSNESSEFGLFKKALLAGNLSQARKHLNRLSGAEKTTANQYYQNHSRKSNNDKSFKERTVDDFNLGGYTSVSGIFQKTKALSKEVEANRIQLQRSFGKNSPFTREFISDLELKGRNLKDLGASFTDLTEVSTAFAEGYVKTATKPMSDTINEYSEFAMVNKRFGVGVGETVEFVNKLTTGANLAGNKIRDLGSRMFQAHRETGVPYATLMRDLKDNFYDLSDQVTKVSTSGVSKEFMKFSAVARRTGESVSTLIGMTKQFDTIGTGMAAGGKMNRLLQHFGSSFDTAKAMMMSRSDRMKYIISRVAKAGDRFRQGSEHQRRAMMVAFRDTGLPEGLIRQALAVKSASGIQALMERTMKTSGGNSAKDAMRKRAGELTSRTELQAARDDGLLKAAVSLERVSKNFEKTITTVIRGVGPNIISKAFGTKFGKKLSERFIKPVENFFNGILEKLNISKLGGLNGPVTINWTKGSRVGEIQANTLNIRTVENQASQERSRIKERRDAESHSHLSYLPIIARHLEGIASRRGQPVSLGNSGKTLNGRTP